ncbi:phosphotransferase [Paenibacillus turicensis]|uniref:phosphotransferase enzyme family protein n=1 Tax=Paenibacillus turicensis TaxID=160487 RepID=UPI003D2BF1E4
MEIEMSEINQILTLLGYHKANIHLLGGYYNNVYEISSEVPIIVKVYNREFDNEETILSEIKWTQFLNENKVNATIPIAVNKKSYINHLTDTLFFVAYQKVVGIHIDPSSEEWNERLFKQWGKGMGKMHSLSKIYKGKQKRPEWDEHKIFQMNMNSIDYRIKERWENYIKNIESMSHSEEVYGIIHGDLTNHNFLCNKGEITFIDFGDSEFNWFAYDIAVAIYHASQTVKDRGKRDHFASEFFKSFMDGYSMENSVTQILQHVDFFINYRHLYSFIYHSQFLQKNQLSEPQIRYLEKMGQSIIKQNTYLGISLV